jgi:hypothetical protein
MISFCIRQQVWLGFVAPLLIISASCLAQSKSLCTRFFQPESKIHTKVECVEALFSEPSWHLTFSSLPPGNGFALGGVYEQTTHYVTPFYPAPLKIAHPDPNLRRYDVPPPVGRVSSTDIKLAIIGSVNQSWVATGSFTLIPPLYTPDRNAGGETCQRLSFLCTRSQLALKFEGTHRSLQTISFYGPRTAVRRGETYLPPERYVWNRDSTPAAHESNRGGGRCGSVAGRLAGHE